MLPPPKGGGFDLNGLKSCSEQSSALMSPAAGRLKGLTERSTLTASGSTHDRRPHPTPRARRPSRDAKGRMITRSGPLTVGFGPTTGQGLLKPSPEGEGFNPPSK